MPVSQLGTGASLVQVDEVEVALAHDPVVDQHDAAGGSQEYRVAGKEGREGFGRVLNVPRGGGERNEDAEVLALHCQLYSSSSHVGARLRSRRVYVHDEC